MIIDDINEQQLVRRQKAQDLRNQGVDPFGQKYVRTHTTKQLIEAYGAFDHDQLEEKHIEVSVAGRIMLKRGQGKAGFMHLQDRDGQIQVYVRMDAVGEASYELFKAASIKKDLSKLKLQFFIVF